MIPDSTSPSSDESVTEARSRYAAGFDITDNVLRSMMDHGPFVCSLKDEDGRYIFYNQRLADRMGISTDAWIGKTDRNIFPGATADLLMEHDRRAMASDTPLVVTEETPETNGSMRRWKVHKFMCRDGHERRMLACMAVDITQEYEQQLELERYQAELQAANERLQELVVTDALTGLRTRRAFEERLEVEFSRSRRGHRPLALAFLDIDNFKQVNDRFGHAAGDVTLRELGSLLQASLRLPDLAARYGGEEFVVLLPESTATDAEGWFRRLTDALLVQAWSSQAITVSVGIAELDDEAADARELLAMADEALYQAKHEGRARAVLFMRPMAE